MGKSLYDFKDLRRFLEKKGYHVGEATGFQTVVEVFKPEEEIKNGKMKFRNDGIFVIKEDGTEHQVFIYKYDYWLHRYGDKKPRFHICKCSIIENFMNTGNFDGHYVRANVDPVPVLSKESDQVEQVGGLPLCQNCANTLRNLAGITSTEFAQTLKEAMGGKDITHEVDIFGYTKDWEQISKKYREKHDYTCEECGIKIKGFDREYVHVHHIDGDKLNNKEKNLKCLCYYCHAKVDDHHYRNLTSGAGQNMYDYFYKKYKDKGYWDDSDMDDEDDDDMPVAPLI